MMVVLPLPKKPDRTVTAETEVKAAHSGGTGMNQRWDAAAAAAQSASLSISVQCSAFDCVIVLLTLREWSLGGAIDVGGLRHGERGTGG